MLQTTSKPFALSAFLEGTNLLKHDELGIYIRLLEHMWISCGKLPNNDRKLANFLNISLKKWQNYKGILQKFFIFSDKNIMHLQLKKKYQKTVKISQQNSLNVAKRWEKHREQISEFEEKKEADSTIRPYIRIGYDRIYDRITCARASKDNYIDIRLEEDDRQVDKSLELGKIEIAELTQKLQGLFNEHGMVLPNDKSLLAEWLESDISKDFIYQKIEQVIARICKHQLEHPRSFAYFNAEIRRYC